MTNGEKLEQVFPDGICPFSKNWLDYEYKEPTTKNETLVSLGAYKQVAWERDIAIQQLHELGYEFGQKIEPTTKNDLEVDCINKQAVLNKILKFSVKDRRSLSNLWTEVNELPLVTPIRPKGHWICDGKGRSFADYHCSECGHKLALCGQDIKQRQDSGYSLFCDGCGADMREVVEE